MNKLLRKYLKPLSIAFFACFTAVACTTNISINTLPSPKTQNESRISFNDKSQAFYDNLARKSVQLHITVPGPWGYTGGCSGVIIHKKLIATAAHCLDPSRDQVKIEFFDGETREMMGIYSYGKPTSGDDWALLWVDIPEKYAKNPLGFNIACKDKQAGTPIVHIGSPGATSFITSFGYVLSHRTPQSNFPYWYNTSLVDILGGPGSSGGPIYDLNGDLVGQIVAFSPQIGFMLYVKPREMLNSPICSLAKIHQDYQKIKHFFSE